MTPPDRAALRASEAEGFSWVLTSWESEIVYGRESGVDPPAPFSLTGMPSSVTRVPVSSLIARVSASSCVAVTSRPMAFWIGRLYESESRRRASTFCEIRFDSSCGTT